MCWKIYFLLIVLSCYLLSPTNAIHCYKCESYRDYRCLDPFDYQPHVLVNCDYESFVRDRKPVFCEKKTELIDGVYTTTRGCSQKQWEEVDIYIDHRNQDLRCFRHRDVEHCLCSHDSCNTAKRSTTLSSILLISSIIVSFTIQMFVKQ